MSTRLRERQKTRRRDDDVEPRRRRLNTPLVVGLLFCLLVWAALAVWLFRTFG
ncbi:MAG: hypothetical protein ACK4RV_01345 [Caulobacter sp.]|jgi:type VI protein secretion system component VasK